MGSHYKKAIFQERTKDAILGWGQKAKARLHKHKGGDAAHGDSGLAMTVRNGSDHNGDSGKLDPGAMLATEVWNFMPCPFIS